MSLPTIQPVALSSRQEPFDNPDWLFELKYDGFRAVLYVEPGSPRLVSRRGLRFARFQQLAHDVAGKLHATTAILDGEIICPDGDGRPNFRKMLSGKPAVCFVAFDAMWLDGEDVRALPLIERKKLLQRILPKRSNLVTVALATQGRGKDLFATVRAHDLEGIVAKRKSDPYRRRVRWWKIKNPGYSQAEGRGELFNPPQALRR